MDKFQIFPIRNLLIMIQIPHKGQHVLKDIFFLTANAEFHGKTISHRIEFQTGFQLHPAKIRISGKRKHTAVQLAIEKAFQFNGSFRCRLPCAGYSSRKCCSAK